MSFFFLMISLIWFGNQFWHVDLHKYISNDLFLIFFLNFWLHLFSLYLDGCDFGDYIIPSGIVKEWCMPEMKKL
jgi:hypothetical protein